MEIDKTTLKDLHIIQKNDEESLFSRFDFTNTFQGKEHLRHIFAHPLKSLEDIIQTQAAIQFIQKNMATWSNKISNGTLLMIEKFYSTSVDIIPANPNEIGAFTYQFFNKDDYGFVKFSVEQMFDFIKGIKAFVQLFESRDTPAKLVGIREEMAQSINKSQLDKIEQSSSAASLSKTETLKLAHFLKYNFKNNVHQLLQLYAKIDAWFSMAQAAQKFGMHYPEFVQDSKPILEVVGLCHPVLQHPVTYSLELTPNKNFLFLTGANMAGKSTFIKAIGICVYLAHLGMAAPAQSIKLSYFDGIISNINIEDDISKGQSYFYNEVRRVRDTVQKVNTNKNWLVLIDELFKGTNVQDAMKCSSSVIEGLLKIKHSLFILSTHLYEIGEPLRQYPNIVFRYFETHTTNGQLEFSYVLKDGISNDRLGYLIMQREGLVDLLKSI